MTTTDNIADAVIEGETASDDEPVLPAPNARLVRRDPTAVFELDQRRANAYAESGYWPDAKSQAQALVKIEAGRALGLPPIVAMSEVHVIQGKPTLGAGALAALVKTSGRYDYRIVEHTEQRCAIRFFDLQAGELGESVFTLDDARKAGLASRSTWRQYPRNMLFARALSNGVAWFCPDTTLGRAYVPEELDGAVIVETDPLELVAEAVVDEDKSRTIPTDRQPTREQKERIGDLIHQLDELGLDGKQEAREIAGVDGRMLTATIADLTIEGLERRLADQPGCADEPGEHDGKEAA
jgi:hypothetical protein